MTERQKEFGKDKIPSKLTSDLASRFSELMTEAELIEYLRIPEISRSNDHRNVIENLKRMHNLPRIHICGKPLYPREAVIEWIRRKTTNGK
jgi:hypothetical protein